MRQEEAIASSCFSANSEVDKNNTDRKYQGWICQGDWGDSTPPPGQKSDPTSKSWTNVLGVVN